MVLKQQLRNILYAFGFQELKCEVYPSACFTQCKQKCTAEVEYSAFYSRPAQARPLQACKRLFLHNPSPAALVSVRKWEKCAERER